MRPPSYIRPEPPGQPGLPPSLGRSLEQWRAFQREQDARAYLILSHHYSRLGDGYAWTASSIMLRSA